ncbi:sulfatase family protein [Halobaculum sp. EA56]|uniref:sulfatase family protein n=1 Tax=Halobaculum sp. EA56 TaxID=3421648 RepID=UPI003EC0CED2
MSGSPQIENVVVVVVDALRAGNLGCYGYEYDTSPRIDEFAGESLQFNNAYVPINNTDPSITAIHSGIHPTVSVLRQGGRVTKEEKQRAETLPRIPELLSDRAGYHSAWTGHVLGRWHRNGFDYFPSERPSHEKRILFKHNEQRERARAALNAISGRFADTVSDLYYRFEQTVGDLTDSVRANDQTETDEIEQLLAQLDVARSSDERFYGYTHLIETHSPYEADDELIEKYLAEHDYPNRPLEAIADPEPPECSPVANVPYAEDWYTERDYEVGVARWYARYDACVTEADTKIGRLIDGLRDRGALDETLVVVMSDHGESLEEHGLLFAHTGLHEPVVNIPLLIRVPGSAGRELSKLVQTIDIAPTVADVFGLSTDELGFHGQSLLPLLRDSHDEEWQDREALLLEEANSQRRRGLVTKDRKYIFAIEGSQHPDKVTCRYCGEPHWPLEELYHLDADPDERNDLSDRHPQEAQELRETAQSMAEAYSLPTQIDVSDVTYDDEEEVIERLEHLGYK